MAPKTGTFAVADLLAAKNTIIGTGDFSAQAIADALRQDNENYNTSSSRRSPTWWRRAPTSFDRSPRRSVAT
jgi:hypothetical protein